MDKSRTTIHNEIQALCNKEWQRETFDFMKSVKYNNDFPDVERLRKRSIYWIEDSKGGSGNQSLYNGFEQVKKI